MPKLNEGQIVSRLGTNGTNYWYRVGKANRIIALCYDVFPHETEHEFVLTPDIRERFAFDPNKMTTYASNDEAYTIAHKERYP